MREIVFPNIFLQHESNLTLTKTGKFAYLGELGQTPQQAVAATDYYINTEIQTPPLLGRLFRGAKTREKRAMHATGNSREN